MKNKRKSRQTDYFVFQPHLCILPQVHVHTLLVTTPPFSFLALRTKAMSLMSTMFEKASGLFSRLKGATHDASGEAGDFPSTTIRTHLQRFDERVQKLKRPSDNEKVLFECMLMLRAAMEQCADAVDSLRPASTFTARACVGLPSEEQGDAKNTDFLEEPVHHSKTLVAGSSDCRDPQSPCDATAASPSCAANNHTEMHTRARSVSGGRKERAKPSASSKERDSEGRAATAAGGPWRSQVPRPKERDHVPYMGSRFDPSDAEEHSAYPSNSEPSEEEDERAVLLESPTEPLSQASDGEREHRLDTWEHVSRSLEYSAAHKNDNGSREELKGAEYYTAGNTAMQASSCIHDDGDIASSGCNQSRKSADTNHEASHLSARCEPVSERKSIGEDSREGAIYALPPEQESSSGDAAAGAVEILSASSTCTVHPHFSNPTLQTISTESTPAESAIESTGEEIVVSPPVRRTINIAVSYSGEGQRRNFLSMGDQVVQILRSRLESDFEVQVCEVSSLAPRRPFFQDRSDCILVHFVRVQSQRGGIARDAIAAFVRDHQDKGRLARK